MKAASPQSEAAFMHGRSLQRESKRLIDGFLNVFTV
jgi:toxin HigB-1